MLSFCQVKRDPNLALRKDQTSLETWHFYQFRDTISVYSGAFKGSKWFYPGDLVTRTGDREIRCLSGRLPDNPGELHGRQTSPPCNFAPNWGYRFFSWIVTWRVQRSAFHARVAWLNHGQSGSLEGKKFREALSQHRVELLRTKHIETKVTIQVQWDANDGLVFYDETEWFCVWSYPWT